MKILFTAFLLIITATGFSQAFILKNVTVFCPAGTDRAATGLLVEEVQKRTGMAWPIVNTWPASGDVIILKNSKLPLKIPAGFSSAAIPIKPESFSITSTLKQDRKIILIEGTDARGLLFGIGRMLRRFHYMQGSISLTSLPLFTESPDKPIRGHQLGYRNTANSYDAWTKAQFEQYIRDLIVFGTNSIESIPIFEETSSPHFKVPPMEMNSFISSLCKKYSLDYWMWIPAQFDLNDITKRKQYLDRFESICKQSARVDGVFFPGGDPGDNSPELVMKLLPDLSIILKKYHPTAKTWLSLQGYSASQNDSVYRMIREQKPTWLGGLITGPSSPTAKETRKHLPSQYMIRHYPDITHNVRCEFEIPWWDPAFSLTEGREAINPRPYHYAAIYREMEPYIDGFISYSDGAHDDVNKILWTSLSWNSKADERQVMEEYSNYFFPTANSPRAADAIIALEKNWQGPIVANGSISTTLQAWQDLAKENPALDSNWRWQMNLMRAYYDDYTRTRFTYETAIEKEVNVILLNAAHSGADEAMDEAQKILVAPPTDSSLIREKNTIIDLCDQLYRSVSLQTSVKKYNASGLERGAVLDFLDRPLNNRWWLEDEFKMIDSLKEEEKIAALKNIAMWEDPGAGGYYDQVGNISRSPHEMKGEYWLMDPVLRKSGNPGYDFSDQGMSRKRLSWLTYMRWPLSMEYADIDTSAKYIIKITGLGESLLKVNGQRITPTTYGKKPGETKEFPVPEDLVRQGKLILTWDDINEDNMNWRLQSRVCEVWLVRL